MLIYTTDNVRWFTRYTSELEQAFSVETSMNPLQRKCIRHRVVAALEEMEDILSPADRNKLIEASDPPKKATFVKCATETIQTLMNILLRATKTMSHYYCVERCSSIYA